MYACSPGSLSARNLRALWVALVLLTLPPALPAQLTEDPRFDSLDVAFRAYFWEEETRPRGLKMIQNLYAADVARGRRDSLTAELLSALGQFHLAMEGEHTVAERYHRSALELGDSLYAFPHVRRAAYRMYLAELFIQQDPRGAETLLRSAVDELRALPVVDHNNIEGSYWNLSRSFMQAGEYQPARDAIELALDDWRTYLPDNPHNGGRLYNQLSRVLLTFEQDLPTAIDAARKGLELARQTRYPVNVAYAYDNLGRAYLKGGRVEQADSIFREMLAFTEKSQKEMNALRGGAYHSLSIANRELGRGEEALLAADRSIEIRQEYAPTTLNGSYAARASALNLLGRHADALVAANEAIAVSDALPSQFDGDRLVFDPTRAYDFDNLRLALTERATALEALGRPRDAVLDYELAIATEEFERSRATDATSRRTLSNANRELYDRAVALIHRLPDRTEADNWRAFGLSEAARGFSLLAELRDRRRVRARREEDLRASIAVYERIERPTAGEKRQLAEQRSRLKELERELGDAGAGPDSASFDLRAYLLTTGENAVEFLLTDSACYSFVYQPGQPLRFVRNGERARIDALAEAWRTRLIERGGGTDLRQPTPAATTDGRQLHDLLFGPARLDAGRATVVITDGGLHFVPFGALPATASTYLCEQTTLRYGYSLRHLAELGELPAAPRATELLALAPSFAGNAGPLYASRAGGREGLRPLLHNEAEARAIADLVGSDDILSGAAATRAAFFARAENARVLHLASHGAVDPLNPNRSFIAFTQTADTLQEDELLYFNDLPLLDLGAELVTLSACETNLGEVVPGEQVLSMGGAFAAAGARSTVSSLWQVDDAATTQLMERFYAELADGKPRAAALAAAQNHLRQSTPFAHPYYWAAFTLHGEDGPIELGHSGGIDWRGAGRWLGYGVAMLLILLGAVRSLRKLFGREKK